MTIRAEQDRAFMTDRELFHERQKDQAYNTRFYEHVDKLLKDPDWVEKIIEQNKSRFSLLLGMECVNKVEAVAASKAARYELERIAEAHARIDVKDED
jgi:hypothetical protein